MYEWRLSNMNLNFSPSTLNMTLNIKKIPPNMRMIIISLKLLGTNQPKGGLLKQNLNFCQISNSKFHHWSRWLRDLFQTCVTLSLCEEKWLFAIDYKNACFTNSSRFSHTIFSVFVIIFYYLFCRSHRVKENKYKFLSLFLNNLCPIW
jgi:hypothetical protein